MEVNPHQLIQEWISEQIADRPILQALRESLFESAVFGLLERLSIYEEVHPTHVITLGKPKIIAHEPCTQVVVPLYANGAALRLAEAVLEWEVGDTSTLKQFVDRVNGRRWRFIEKFHRPVLVPLLRMLADLVERFYELNPTAPTAVATNRFCEDPDQTFYVVEIADTSVLRPNDPAANAPKRWR